MGNSGARSRLASLELLQRPQKRSHRRSKFRLQPQGQEHDPDSANRALQAARIVSETTKCLWRASRPTWTITGHLLLRQRRYGFHVLDRIDRERDGAVLP